jgi:hypothetical protein
MSFRIETFDDTGIVGWRLLALVRGIEAKADRIAINLRQENSGIVRVRRVAHAVGDASFKAYNRNQLVELRRPMMEAWTKYACQMECSQ